MDHSYTDVRKKEINPEHVPGPAMADPEGRQMRYYSNGDNGESYVVKTERVIRHTAPVLSHVVEYRYSTEAGREEVFRDYRVDQEFLTKILDKASQPIKAALPMTPAWNSGSPNPKHTNMEAHEKKLGGNGTWRKPNEPYILNNKGAYPLNSSKDVYDRTKGSEALCMPSRPLSKPTNNIVTAMEFLKEGIKTTYSNKEGFTSNIPSDKTSQPAKVVPVSTESWPTRSNVAGKKEPNQNHLENQSQHAHRNIPDGYGKPKLYDGNHSVPQAKLPLKKNEYEEIIDSSEASRRYGKSSSLPTAEQEYERTINSKEAVEMYKGAFVPW